MRKIGVKFIALAITFIYAQFIFSQHTSAIDFDKNIARIDSLFYVFSPYEALFVIDSLENITAATDKKFVLDLKRSKALTFVNMFTEAVYLGNDLLENELLTPIQEIELRNNLALCYEYTGSFTACKQQLDLVKVLFNYEDSIHSEYARFLLRQVSYYRLTGQKETAVELNEQLIEFASSYGYLDHLGNAYYLKAFFTDVKEERIIYLQNALESFKVIKSYSGMAGGFLSMSNAVSKTGTSGKSILYLDSVITLCKNKEEVYLKSVLADAYFQKAEYLGSLGAHALANDLLVLHLRLAEESRVEKQVISLGLLSIEMERIKLIEAETKKTQLEKEVRLKTGIGIALIFIVLMLFVLAFLSFRVIQQKNNMAQLRKDKDLQAKEIELNNERVKTKKSIRTIEGFKLELTKASNKIQELQKNSKGTLNNEELEALKGKTILTQDDWIDFKAIFDKNYPAFIKRFNKVSNNLTTAELRVLMLKKIGLSNLSMAESLGVNINTIHKTISRTRQKLDLNNTALEDLIKKS
jgi:hypothetical protein